MDVYRLGGAALLNGRPLYDGIGPTDIGVELPFTYPPFAAILFAPFGAFPYWVANLTLALLSALCLAATLRTATREVLPIADASAQPWLAAFVIACSSYPVVETFAFGQINIVLMSLVVFDTIVLRDKKGQGIATGMAMAVKLTPAVFLAYFLVTRRWRSLAYCLSSALTCSGIAWLILPSDSARFWTRTITDPARIGALDFAGNQSLNGALVRFGAPQNGGFWFVICAGIGLSLLWVMHRLAAQQEHLAAVLCMAFFALLASPVSWAHHWVWTSVALVQLATWAMQPHSMPARLALAVGGLSLWSDMLRRLPQDNHAEQSWSAWQHICGNSHVIFGITLILCLAWRAMNAPADRSRPMPRPIRGGWLLGATWLALAAQSAHVWSHSPRQQFLLQTLVYSGLCVGWMAVQLIERRAARR